MDMTRPEAVAAAPAAPPAALRWPAPDALVSTVVIPLVSLGVAFVISWQTGLRSLMPWALAVLLVPIAGNTLMGRLRGRRSGDIAVWSAISIAACVAILLAVAFVLIVIVAVELGDWGGSRAGD